MSDARAVVERTFRAESGRALATLARLLGDVGAAEDAVQEAFVEALRTWPARGVPDRPGAWITTTARNRALDRVRREARRPDREAAAGARPRRRARTPRHHCRSLPTGTWSGTARSSPWPTTSCG